MSALPVIGKTQFRLLRIKSIRPDVHLEVLTCPLPSGSARERSRPFPLTALPKRLTKYLQRPSGRPRTLEHQQRYSAISYAWGDQGKMCEIKVNDKLFKVTEGLRTMLLHLYSLIPLDDNCQWFWIDQVCIDQNNLSEKAMQVKVMNLIYSGASLTYIWLGPAEDNSELALNVFTSIQKDFPRRPGRPIIANNVDNDAELHERLVQLARTLAEDRLILSAICKLLARPWFERLWVVQEIVLSANIVAICGERTFPWSSLVHFCSIFQSLDFMFIFNERQDTDEQAQIMTAFDHATNCDNLERSRRDRDAPRLIDLVRSHSSRLTSRPIDRLFALRGLLSEEQRSWLRVDYEAPELEVHVECWNTILAKMPDSQWQVFERAATTMKTETLPSWCPDLTDSRGDGVPLSPAFTRPFHQVLSSAPVSTRSDPPNSISVAGLMVDEVSEVGPPSVAGSPVYKVANWERRCFHLFQSLCPNEPLSDEDLVIYIRTLLCQHLRDPQSTAVKYFDHEDSQSLCSLYRDFQEALEDMDYEIELADTWVNSAIFRNSIFSTLRINQTMRFFTTTDGRIGMGPRFMQRRDLIFSLDGCPGLWVFRKIDGSIAHKLIGTAYIDGHMFHGLEAVEKDTDNPQVIVA